MLIIHLLFTCIGSQAVDRRLLVCAEIASILGDTQFECVEIFDLELAAGLCGIDRFADWHYLL